MCALVGSSDHRREFSTRLGEVDSHGMFEDSPEAFVSRWQRHAADVELFPHREGSPLLECRAGGAILQLFERTGPYLSRPGRLKVVLHPVTQALEVLEPGSAAAELTVTGISSVLATGTVVAAEGDLVVVDAGAPLVVGVLERLPAGLEPGQLVRFEAAAPVHGFVVTAVGQGHASPRRGHGDDSI